MALFVERGEKLEQFTLDLLDNQRPIIYLELRDKKAKINAMLDSGALFPIWVTDEDLLIDMGAVLVKKGVEIGGFGGKAHGNLYKFDYIQIGKLTYPECYIVASKLDLPCHLILSATMFQNLIYEIDDKNHKLNVSVPDDESTIRNLVIEDRGGELHVLCSSAS